MKAIMVRMDTHVYDFSGSGNNGTGIGFDLDEVQTSGKINGSFEFDGTNDYVSITRFS